VKPGKRGRRGTIAGGALKAPPAKEKTLDDYGIDKNLANQARKWSTRRLGERMEDERAAGKLKRGRKPQLGDSNPQLSLDDRGVGKDLAKAARSAKRRDLTASTRALAAARAWKRAVDDGRVQPQGARTDQPLAKVAKGLIADPRGHFTKLFRANTMYAQQAYALVTRDPAAAREAASEPMQWR
jgi:hypothetical protein